MRACVFAVENAVFVVVHATGVGLCAWLARFVGLSVAVVVETVLVAGQAAGFECFIDLAIVVVVDLVAIAGIGDRSASDEVALVVVYGFSITAAGFGAASEGWVPRTSILAVRAAVPVVVLAAELSRFFELAGEAAGVIVHRSPIASALARVCCVFGVVGASIFAVAHAIAVVVQGAEVKDIAGLCYFVDFTVPVVVDLVGVACGAAWLAWFVDAAVSVIVDLVVVAAVCYRFAGD